MSTSFRLFSAPRRASWALAAVTLAWPLAAQEAADPLVARSVAAARDTLDASLRLSGDVVDAAGRPLNGVEAELTIARYDPGAPTLAREERSTRLVDGFFQFSCDPCIAIDVTFYRAGFHWEKIGVSVEKATARPATIERQHQRVVLREIGVLPKLRYLRGALSLREAGEEEALPVAPEAQGRTAIVSTLVAKAGGGGSLPAIRLKSGMEADGRLATRALEGKAAPAPSGARLDFSGVGGVRRYQPLARAVHQIAYEMREAPEDGYESSLAVDPEAGEVIYFFCKIGELYGRGTATPAVVEEVTGGRRVVSFVEIALNPDGSRNLETLE